MRDASTYANPMNQDGDAINGESTDAYSGGFSLAAVAVASYPFTEDFEAGSIGGLGAHWGFAVTGTGTISVSAQTPVTAGSYSLLLDHHQPFSVSWLLLTLRGGR